MISTTQGRPARELLPLDEPPERWDDPSGVVYTLIAMHLDPDDIFRVPKALAEMIPSWAERSNLHGTNEELAKLGQQYKARCPETIVLDLLRRYYQDRRRRLRS